MPRLLWTFFWIIEFVIASYVLTSWRDGKKLTSMGLSYSDELLLVALMVFGALLAVGALYIYVK